MKISQPQASLGRLLVIGSAVAWSFAGTFTKGVEANVWTVLFWRGLLAAGMMLAYLAWRHGPSDIIDATKLGAPDLAGATAGCVATICFIAALKNTAIANVGIIYATAPFAAAGIGWLLMQERPALATMVAAGFCLVGVVVMVSGWAGTPNLTATCWRSP
ncbi:MAG: hypothetical protein CMM46_17840 [Rhodospirillaceae bacterium]|nr:hypothetical protein [Rhodospirillaceae bacterium]